MRLLIITQKVDKNDDILGFFHRWILEFAKHFEFITVAALEVGEYNLPENVKVLSLGKENTNTKVRPLSLQRSNLCVKIFSKIKYIFNFYRYIFRERKNYDAVFVHMNQEYILLGAVLWKLFGKKITMWRNHAKGNWMTKLAVLFSDKVFYTSPQSFTARFKKSKIMPAGIDVKIFRRNLSIERNNKTILSIGRISPVKNIDVLIDALNILDNKNVDFIANIYGNATDKDKEYYNNIRKNAMKLEEKKKIVFHDSVPYRQIHEIYNRNNIFVNLTSSGSFDKTILEAMACGCITVVSNKSFKDMLSEQLSFNEANPISLSKKLYVAMLLSEDEREKYQKSLSQYVAQHDVSMLANELFNVLNTCL